MSEPSSTRGRGSTPSGRSSSRRPGRRFFSPSVIKAAETAVADEKKNLEYNSTMVENSKGKFDTNRDKVINEGMSFINSQFSGFVQSERGNIKVEIDDYLPTRIAKPYADAADEHLSVEFDFDEDQKETAFKQFIGVFHVATSIKLHHSAPQVEKNQNLRITNFSGSKLRMPRKAGHIIDQFGKTDLQHDNRIRINNQNLASKRQLVRGLVYFLGDRLSSFISHKQPKDVFKFLSEIVEDPQFFQAMIDSHSTSLSRLKTLGKQSFLRQAESNYKFKDSGNNEFEFRLPAFKFEEDNTLNQIITYLNNPIFTAFNWDGKTINKVVGSLVFQIAEISWLRNVDKTMKELNTAFNGTIIKDVVFNDILKESKIWNINSFISDEELDDMLGLVIHEWNSSKARLFEKVISFVDFQFSEFGSDSQLVELTGKKDYKKGLFNVGYHYLKGKQKANCKVKITEKGAIMGVMSGLVTSVSITNNFEVNYNNKNSSILNEFIRSDFKTK